jgi:hypothetical protein
MRLVVRSPQPEYWCWPPHYLRLVLNPIRAWAVWFLGIGVTSNIVIMGDEWPGSREGLDDVLIPECTMRVPSTVSGRKCENVKMGRKRAIIITFAMSL